MLQKGKYVVERPVFLRSRDIDLLNGDALRRKSDLWQRRQPNQDPRRPTDRLTASFERGVDRVARELLPFS